MTYPIRKVGVIGAGTMGAAIAAHVANAGLPVVLLDIVPNRLSAKQEAQGLSLDDPAVRNSLVRGGFERMQKARPAALMSQAAAELITIGNTEDNFDLLADVDWVVEVIIEKLEPKQALMARLEATCKSETLITSNTSGLPIAAIAEGRSESFKARFFGTHFFNPPRYLKLMEIIATPDTDPAAIDAMVAFAETRLGKGVVHCKDTPNFIGNRLFAIDSAFTTDYALRHGYSIAEVDAITGPLMGRPKTATFRLQDLVGIDVAAHVSRNLYELIPDDPRREVLVAEAATRVSQGLLERGWLGNKSDQGFYQRTKERDEKGSTIFNVLNPETFEYEAPSKIRFESVGEVRNIEELGPRLRALFSEQWREDRAAQLAWAVTANTLSYAAAKLPEIAHDLYSIDNAIRWGFSHEAGPFELWDLLGVAETAGRMAAEDYPVATWVQTMLDQGYETFYRYEGGRAVAQYDPATGEYRDLPRDERRLTIADLRAAGDPLAGNDSASLLNMGDGVLLLEFHAKMNAIDQDMIEMMITARQHLDQPDVRGLVVGNEGNHFCAGANIFAIAVGAQQGMLDQVEGMVEQLQNALQGFRFSPKPVVIAPFNMCLGGGAEVVMAGARRVAHAESYIGLVEGGVGVIPAGGGIKELVRRILSRGMAMGEHPDALDLAQRVFQTIGLAKVGTSAAESRDLGFLDESDRIIMNRDFLLFEAKQEVLAMVQAGYTPPPPAKLYAGGRDLLAALKMGLWTMRQGDYISDHDHLIGQKLAKAIAGGNHSAPTWVDEDHFLMLEREGFMALAAEEKTLARMWHMLQTGKPLRN